MDNSKDIVTKKDLAAQMTEDGYFPSKKAAETAIDALFGHVAIAVHHDQKVRISGFGAFSLRHKPARKARNPVNGESVDVPAKDVMVFKASK